MKDVLVQALPLIIQGVFALLGILLTWALGKGLRRIAAEKDVQGALDALRQGIALAQDDFVEWAKRAKEDGTLSKEECEIARQKAFEHAVQIANGKSLELLKNWSWQQISGYINRIVQTNKV